MRALQARDAERSRLLEVARDAGARIREHLEPGDLIAEACAVIKDGLGADAAHLHLLGEAGEFGLPDGHQHDESLPDGFAGTMPPAAVSLLRECHHRGASLVVRDLASGDGTALPPDVRAWVRDAGIACHLLVPFGDGPEMLGVIAAPRFSPDRPWTQPEVEAVESIAADIGRGLRHARLYEAEKRLVTELKSVTAMKTELFTTVAHELRAPLTSIEGYAEMLSGQDAGTVTDTQRQMLGAIERSVRRLRDLIDDLLTLAKLEADQPHPVREEVNLADIVATTADALRPAAAGGGVTLTISSPPSGLAALGDAAQLSQALTNVLSNAVKYTPQGGHVSIVGAAEGDWAVLTVQDDGIGIPEADCEQLFTRFFRASNAVERRIPGTGLGLSIVQNIIGNHGGTVSLRSRQNEGTTVTLRLPSISGTAGPRGQSREGSVAFRW